MNIPRRTITGAEQNKIRRARPLLKLRKLPQGLPQLKLGAAMLVAHQTHTDRNSLPYYDAARIAAIAEAVAGQAPKWAPISPVVRDDLRKTAPELQLTDDDWHNLVFPEEWACHRPVALKSIPVIGRHGRADKDKWPATKQDILAVYPDEPDLEVRLLGTGDYLKRVMGTFPANWTAHRFGQMEPQDFLKTIDLAKLALFEQARNLSVDLLKDWLVKYKFKDWNVHRTTNPGTDVTPEEKLARAEDIATALSDHKRWRSHGRNLNVAKLRELRIDIDDYTSETVLSGAIRSYNDPLTGYVDRLRSNFFMHNHRLPN